MADATEWTQEVISVYFGFAVSEALELRPRVGSWHKVCIRSISMQHLEAWSVRCRALLIQFPSLLATSTDYAVA